MWIKCLLVILLFSNSVNGQQRIVSGSYLFAHQFNLFEKVFTGRIQVVRKFYYKEVTEQDTVNYISDKTGLFEASDTSKFNLDDMFEGIFFDYNSKSQSYVDRTGMTVKIFDTSYKYGEDHFAERILFYPKSNFFILRLHKNSDTNYRYMSRSFDNEKRIKTITYYGKHEGILIDAILSYLARAKFSEIYEFNYQKIKGEKKITELNYYRYDEKNRNKRLYASNKYTYGKDGLVKRIDFSQFNGVARVKGEVFYNYFPNQSEN